MQRKLSVIRIESSTSYYEFPFRLWTNNNRSLLRPVQLQRRAAGNLADHDAAQSAGAGLHGCSFNVGRCKDFT